MFIIALYKWSSAQSSELSLLTTRLITISKQYHYHRQMITGRGPRARSWQFCAEFTANSVLVAPADVICFANYPMMMMQTQDDLRNVPNAPGGMGAGSNRKTEQKRRRPAWGDKSTTSWEN